MSMSASFLLYFVKQNMGSKDIDGKRKEERIMTQKDIDGKRKEESIRPKKKEIHDLLLYTKMVKMK